MPDFATSPGAHSPAHAQLAAAIHDPMDDLPVRLLALAGRTTLRFVIVSPAVAPFRFESDCWWGRISRSAILLGRCDTLPIPHSD
jgi:hypothetical protein